MQRHELTPKNSRFVGTLTIDDGRELDVFAAHLTAVVTIASELPRCVVGMRWRDKTLRRTCLWKRNVDTGLMDPIANF